MESEVCHSSQGDVRKLTDDISTLKPSVFVAVPRVLERIQAGIQSKLAAKPWIMRAIVGLAMRWKLARVKAGVPLHKVESPLCCPLSRFCCCHVSFAGAQLELVSLSWP